MNLRLVHNYDGLPDVRVWESSTYAGPNWYKSGHTCDNGGTTEYYTELAYYLHSLPDVQRVSPTVELSHC